MKSNEKLWTERVALLMVPLTQKFHEEVMRSFGEKSKFTNRSFGREVV